MARPEGFEPPTLGFVVKALELPNLLKLLEAVDITNLLVSKLFPIFVQISTFWNHFHTQIHT
jgi:hypothetical protein